MGNFRVQYFEPKTGQGALSLELMSDKIAGWFKRGSTFSYEGVNIIFDFSPTQSDLLYENDLVFITVDCTYRCDIIETTY